MFRAKEDPVFRQELIVEATNAFLDGDVDTGKRLLRDYLNATEAFPSIAGELNVIPGTVNLFPGGNARPVQSSGADEY